MAIPGGLRISERPHHGTGERVGERQRQGEKISVYNKYNIQRRWRIAWKRTSDERCRGREMVLPIIHFTNTAFVSPVS